MGATLLLFGFVTKSSRLEAAPTEAAPAEADHKKSPALGRARVRRGERGTRRGTAVVLRT